MNDTMTDEQLLAQPIGYWSWAAATSVRDHIRGHLATVGVTQPQWWVLNQLGDPDGMHTRHDLTELLQGYLDVGDQLQADIDDLIARHHRDRRGDGHDACRRASPDRTRNTSAVYCNSKCAGQVAMRAHRARRDDARRPLSDSATT